MAIGISTPLSIANRRQETAPTSVVLSHRKGPIYPRLGVKKEVKAMRNIPVQIRLSAMLKVGQW